MNYLDQANSFCRRLWRDESGVVLALTVVVFLTLFVIACSVYAVGENIRQRIELQNAADAASYSAAVVQADALSRVAAINKAMAWTYVQMGRAVMDYDVDVWLEWTKKTYENRESYLNMWIHMPSFSCPCYYISSSGSCPPGGQRLILLHQIRPITIDVLIHAYDTAQYHYQYYGNQIDRYRLDIRGMNTAETDIINNLQSRIANVIDYVLRRDTGSPDQENFCYSVLSSPAATYFKTPPTEALFLGFLDGLLPKDALSLFGWGTDYWFMPNPRNGGIQRQYTQSNYLRAEWNWYGEGWTGCPCGPGCWNPCCYRHTTMGSEHVTGLDAKTMGGHSQNYYETEMVKPQKLKDTYFQPAGAIVVSVARRMTNPLALMAGAAADPLNVTGLYGFFNPSNGFFMWVASAARAGYRKNGGGVGEYWTQNSDGWLSSNWNLSQTDWDAEFITLQRASTPGTPVLQQFWDSAKWQPLFNAGVFGGQGLGSFASGAAPVGLTGAISFSDESVVLH